MSDIKYYAEMDFFHVLNRGVDKRKVFNEEIDYVRFIHDIYEFNDMMNSNGLTSQKFSPKILDVGHQVSLKRKREVLVKIHAFALMPNHYHLLLSPVVEDGIPLFMKKLNAGYTKYFNKRYERVGTLWQSGYKSVPIETNAHFNFIPFYIHFNPLDLFAPEWRKQCPAHPDKALAFLESYRWSSHRDYLGEKNFPSVTYRDFFLDSFGGTAGYKKRIARELKGFEMDESVSLE
jgi:putative transposase